MECGEGFYLWILEPSGAFGSRLSFFLQSQRLPFRKKCGCQRLPKLMGVKGEFSWCIMRTECLHRDQFRQRFSGLQTWDVTSVVQALFP